MKTANKVVSEVESKIVMSVAGAILIIASILKAHQLLTEPIVSTGFWESWLFFIIQIPLELGLGIWLISGLFKKACWLLSLIAFAGFIGITFIKGIAGAESCGCFGKVHVNPWITLLAIDTPLFALLAIFRPKGQKLLPPPWPTAKHFFAVAIPTFLILATIVPVLVLNKPPSKTSKYEVVNPKEWLNPQGGNANTTAQWPLLEHIDIAESIKTGLVVVFMYHYDCPTCKEAIPDYEKMNQTLSGNQIKLCYIDIPPYAPQENNPVPPDTAALVGKLDSTKTWYIQTPLVVLLNNGSCVQFWQGQAPNRDQIIEAIAQN